VAYVYVPLDAAFRNEGALVALLTIVPMAIIFGLTVRLGPKLETAFAAGMCVSVVCAAGVLQSNPSISQRRLALVLAGELIVLSVFSFALARRHTWSDLCTPMLGFVLGVTTCLALSGALTADYFGKNTVGDATVYVSQMLSVIMALWVGWRIVTHAYWYRFYSEYRDEFRTMGWHITSATTEG
jgi:hypothetical protein